MSSLGSSGGIPGSGAQPPVRRVTSSDRDRQRREEQPSKKKKPHDEDAVELHSDPADAANHDSQQTDTPPEATDNPTKQASEPKHIDVQG